MLLRRSGVRGQYALTLHLHPTGETGVEGATPHHLVRRGYNVVAWSADGLAYWAVSDLNQDELREFATLIRNAR